MHRSKKFLKVFYGIGPHWQTFKIHDDEISKVKRVLEGRGQTEDEEVVTKLQRDPRGGD